MKATINIFTIQTKDGPYEAISPQTLMLDLSLGQTDEDAVKKLVQNIPEAFLNQRNACIEQFNAANVPYTVTSIPIVFDIENVTVTFSESSMDITRKMNLVTDLSTGKTIEELLQGITRPCEIGFLNSIKGKNPALVAYELGQQIYKTLHK